MKTEGEKVLEALKDMPYQTAAQLGRSAGVDRYQLTAVIGQLVTEEKIASTVVGEVRVYFLAANVPAGPLFNTGEGYFAVRQEDAAEEVEPLPWDSVTTANTYEDGEVRQSAPPPKRGGRKPRVVGAETVRDLAAQGLSRAEAAGRLGLAPRSFDNYLYAKKDLMDAWKAGAAIAAPASHPEIPEHTSAVPSDIVSATAVDVPSTDEISTEIQECVVAPETEAESSSAIVRRSPDDLPDPNIVLFHAEPLRFARRSSQSTCVELSNGGTIEINAEIDLFTASDAEAALFSTIVGAVQKYREVVKV